MEISGEFWISKNRVITLSAGDYSDYYYEGPFICNSSFDLSEVARAVDGDPVVLDKPQALIHKLLSSGLIRKIDCREIHIGSNNIVLSE